MSVSSTPSRPPPLQVPNDTDLDVKVKKGVERISENLHISANEPSLALYRLQEHVRRAAPPTVARRQHVAQLHAQLQGACYDVEYAVSAVHAMSPAASTLRSMQELLTEAIFHRQQIKYENMRRRKQTPSMYKRLSSHLQTLDLPDFPDFPDALRETATRVESALHQAKTTYDSHQHHQPNNKNAGAGRKQKGSSNVTGNVQDAGNRNNSRTSSVSSNSASSEQTTEKKMTPPALKSDPNSQENAAAEPSTRKKFVAKQTKEPRIESQSSSHNEVTTSNVQTARTDYKTNPSDGEINCVRFTENIMKCEDSIASEPLECERESCSPTKFATTKASDAAATEVDTDEEYDCLM